MSRNYIEQYERMKRKYEVLSREKVFIKNEEMYVLYEDEIYNFFMNCYHLKDWLKMSNKNNFSDVEDLFDKNNGNFYMKICADLCNGIKHMVADRRSRLDENMKIEKGSLITVPLTANIIANSKNIKNPKKIRPVGARSELVCWVSVNNKSYNAFDIATQCMDEWEKYLKFKNAI